MTQKERLVELLRKEYGSDVWLGATKCGVYSAQTKITGIETVADYLLSHGVIVPPCKVGDVVYDIGVFSKVMKAEVATMMTDGSEFLSAVVIPRKPHHRWLVNWKNAGKTVFLTREEAEQALKEREKDE